jgi:hypothetical protein
MDCYLLLTKVTTIIDGCFYIGFNTGWTPSTRGDGLFFEGVFLNSPSSTVQGGFGADMLGYSSITPYWRGSQSASQSLSLCPSD